MKQRSCVLVKPDGVQKKLIGKVLERFEGEGFSLIGLKMLPRNSDFLKKFYAEHEGKPFYGALMEFMTSGPIVACVWEGEEIIPKIRKLIGATDSKKAEPGTLRNQYGTDGRINLVHASDSPASAEREIGLIFRQSELAAEQNFSAVV